MSMQIYKHHTDKSGFLSVYSATNVLPWSLNSLVPRLPSISLAISVNNKAYGYGCAWVSRWMNGISIGLPLSVKRKVGTQYWCYSNSWLARCMMEWVLIFTASLCMLCVTLAGGRSNVTAARVESWDCISAWKVPLTVVFQSFEDHVALPASLLEPKQASYGLYCFRIVVPAFAWWGRSAKYCKEAQNWSRGTMIVDTVHYTHEIACGIAITVCERERHWEALMYYRSHCS